MVLNDPLASALSHIFNLEKLGRKECMINPTSKTIQSVFDVLIKEGYLGQYEVVEDGKGNHLKLTLLGNINRCGVIKPRHATSVEGLDKFEKRFLPAQNFGVIIVSTPQGIMTHREAREKNVGGKLLAYCY